MNKRTFSVGIAAATPDQNMGKHDGGMSFGTMEAGAVEQVHRK